MVHAAIGGPQIPVTYPTTSPEICLPELDGMTSKMYRGGKICLTDHFKPLWVRSSFFLQTLILPPVIAFFGDRKLWRLIRHSDCSRAGPKYSKVWDCPRDGARAGALARGRDPGFASKGQDQAQGGTRGRCRRCRKMTPHIHAPHLARLALLYKPSNQTPPAQSLLELYNYHVSVAVNATRQFSAAMHVLNRLFPVVPDLDGVEAPLGSPMNRPVRCWCKVVHCGKRLAGAYQLVEPVIVDPGVPSPAYQEAVRRNE